MAPWLELGTWRIWERDWSEAVLGRPGGERGENKGEDAITDGRRVGKGGVQGPMTRVACSRRQMPERKSVS